METADSDSIMGNDELLSLCFRHILDNSINHSDPGSQIRIKTEAGKEEVICTVSDQGPGFSEGAMKNLFQMFAPGESHVDSNKGLSLYLVKLVIDAHQGKIEVQNNMDKGATVKLTFGRNATT
jgi:signal transduction histidine kinase